MSLFPHARFRHALLMILKRVGPHRIHIVVFYMFNSAVEWTKDVPESYFGEERKDVISGKKGKRIFNKVPQMFLYLKKSLKQNILVLKKL